MEIKLLPDCYMRRMTMRRRIACACLRCAVALLAAATWPSAAHAQGHKDARECEKAAKIIDKGRPAHKQQDALATLLQCGEVGATATALAILDSRAEQDTLVLLKFWQTADGWRDGTVMQAALEVSRDGSAAAPARVFAISHLLILISPGAQYPYGNLIRSTEIPELPAVTRSTLRCRSGYANHWGNTAATPLPSDYRAQLLQALAQLRESPSAPIAVRNAAWCAGS